MNNYPVFILAGGKGTRFPEETKFKPKPMIDILKKLFFSVRCSKSASAMLFLTWRRHMQSRFDFE